MYESSNTENTTDSKNDPSQYDDGRDRSISSKDAARRQLEEDMAKFLGQGGAIQNVDANVRADPPKKPQSNYGSRPI